MARPLSGARTGSGAVSTAAFIAFTTRVRSATTCARLASRSRRACRSPRARGDAGAGSARIWRAARSASISSLLPRRRPTRFGRSTSQTVWPRALQRCGQPGPVTAGALDRPHHRAGGLAIGVAADLRVAGSVGRAPRPAHQRPGLGGQHRHRVGVFVGVDADDVLHVRCQDSHDSSFQSGDCYQAPAWGLTLHGRTVIRHTGNGGQASYQASQRWPGRRHPV